jgi:hypothetical protein
LAPLGFMATALLLAGWGSGGLSAAEAPPVRELRTQRVGNTIYFQVRFDIPKDMDREDQPTAGPAAFDQLDQQDTTRQPHLVPQDDNAHAVYRRFTPTIPFRLDPERRPQEGPRPVDGRNVSPAPPRQVPVPVEGLQFIGKAKQEGPAKFLLLYPARRRTERLRTLLPSRRPRPQRPLEEARKAERLRWAEVPVTLDLAGAQKIAVPASAAQRKPNQFPASDDLEGLWAVAQAGQFALLESEVSDFGFYGFAREATGRKYGVPAPAVGHRGGQPHRPDVVDRELFEMTTGAAAITESLQRRRMLATNPRSEGERKVEIAKVPGIDIAEHPWQQMIGDQKPSIEPLARFVPQDNYYLHFKNVRALLELGDLLDQWGTSLVHAYEVNSRDLDLRHRYEKQLCLKSTPLGRLLGPTVIQSLAVTGNDLYLREGSDVTILFQARNRELLLNALEPFLNEARQESGNQLHEGKETYQGVPVESFVTPLREVSLYRASVDDVVIYANSKAALQRVLDARQGRSKALADALDFQYMRTVFRLDDPQESGFLFLSDAFIRQLVGPASKIKEKRRLEALTSLAMVTNGVLFTAWETAKLPADQKGLLHASGLKTEELYAPGGKDVAWDAGQRVAVSDVYNTQRFATPLIELPIDRVTQAEAQGYERFRAEYLGLWRQYFDPIGMRLSLTDARVRVETYILPLIQSSAYNRLRQEVGGGTTTLDPASISPKTLVSLKTHINPQGTRRELLRLASILNGRVSLDFLGDWFLVQLDDSPIYAKLAELYLRDEDLLDDPRQAFDLLAQLPLTVGVEVRQPLPLALFLGVVRSSVLAALPQGITWEPMDPAYKGVAIVRIQADPEAVGLPVGNGQAKNKKPATLALYYAVIDGAFYLSLSEDSIKRRIDRSVARREGKEPAQPEKTVPINSSLYVAPGAAMQAGGALRMLLEYQVHQQALANNPILYALYRTGLVGEKASAEEVRAVALKYLGFAPLSPDGAAYEYNPRTDEVVNRRHGSLRQPRQHRGLRENSPLNQLLEQMQSLRADLRFREDGIHTVLTLERKAPRKEEKPSR